jgi:hypothetical protein
MYNYSIPMEKINIEEVIQLTKKINDGFKFDDKRYILPSFDINQLEASENKNKWTASFNSKYMQMMCPLNKCGMFTKKYLGVVGCGVHIPWSDEYCPKCYDLYLKPKKCKAKDCKTMIYKYMNQIYCQDCSKKCPCGKMLLKDPFYQCKTQIAVDSFRNVKEKKHTNRMSICDSNPYCKKCCCFFMVNLGKPGDYMCKNCALQPQTRKEKKIPRYLKLQMIPKLGFIFPMLPTDISWIIYNYI